LEGIVATDEPSISYLWVRNAFEMTPAFHSIPLLCARHH
jgi:hypothetical protein